MNTQEFEAALQADQYGEITRVERHVGYQLAEHQHPFDACALITTGEITLVVGGVATTYAVGEIFRLPAGTPHLERAGPSGVSYLVGRREVAAP
ncbi:cupin domain-containing protein [Polaromonas sp.]|uniref:cupin domain-containing protein n=1 Tax=Polaromonas sp. TaxID=1869339 RepID=UPI00286D595F|nr:cupin domain-containing protein [Polaromonas sp.]